MTIGIEHSASAYPKRKPSSGNATQSVNRSSEIGSLREELPEICPRAAKELPGNRPGPAEELPRSFPRPAQAQTRSCLHNSCQILSKVCTGGPQAECSSCPGECPASFLGVKANCVYMAQNMSHALADSASQEEIAHLQMGSEERPILPHRSL